MEVHSHSHTTTGGDPMGIIRNVSTTKRGDQHYEAISLTACPVDGLSVLHQSY
ncbi:MAG: hypothetical protein ACFE95_07290 [Candidatus Hodarchaeota archaeon]